MINSLFNQLHRLAQPVFALLISVLAGGSLTHAAYAAPVPLSISIGAGQETLLLSLPTGQKASLFTLQNPDRLVVDIAHKGSSPHITLPQNYGGQLVRSVRSGQFNPTTGRIVFELSRPVLYSSEQRGNALNITISSNGKAATQPAAAPPPPPAKKVIIIDPGHGGQDPGTTGKRKTQEKNLVLAYANELKRELEKDGKYEAQLTRKGDYYIALRERIKYAHDRKGDLFLSIHADSASSKAEGLSVYTLSENASDKEAEALAARENRSDIIAGIDLNTHDTDVAGILISLAQRETNNKSALLADALVATMIKHNVPLLENTHRFAGFAVLKSPDIPSVLVEVGFLSNPQEEKNLNNASYRAKLVKALKSSVDHYFKIAK